jgi:hypothetical protein
MIQCETKYKKRKKDTEYGYKSLKYD